MPIRLDDTLFTVRIADDDGLLSVTRMSAAAKRADGRWRSGAVDKPRTLHPAPRSSAQVSFPTSGLSEVRLAPERLKTCFQSCARRRATSTGSIQSAVATATTIARHCPHSIRRRCASGSASYNIAAASIVGTDRLRATSVRGSFCRP